MSDNLLSLMDVMRAIEKTETRDRSAMNRYLAEPGVSELLGASGSGRSIKYPTTHLWLFRDLAGAHERGDVAPRTAVAYLRSRIHAGPVIDAEGFVVRSDDETGQSVNRSIEHPNDRSIGQSVNRSTEHPNDRTIALAPITAQVERIAVVLADTMIERVRASGIVPEAAPVEDRLIGREEVAAMLCLSERPHLVARRVAPVLPGAWSRVQVLRYIEGLRAAADAKATQKKGKR